MSQPARMLRYVILAWTASDGHQTAAARLLALRLQSTSGPWVRALDCEGLIVLHAGGGHTRGTGYGLFGSAGAIVGQLFPNCDAPASTHVPACLDHDETTRIVATGCSHLLSAYWGRYVAVTRDPASGAIRVLRDPTGGLPCFHTVYRRAHVFFSDIEDLLSLGLFTFSLDWQHIARTIALSTTHVRSTGLLEVAEVQPGECFELRADALTRTHAWNPGAIARSHALEDPAEAASHLARTIQACVDAWASRHAAVVLNLSGGLDSSIVLSCLTRSASRPAVTGLNYFSVDPEGDERSHARLAATAMGCELIEHQLDAEAVRLREVLHIARSAKPWFYLYDLEHGGFEAGLASSRHATALFSGAGGDSLFFIARAALAPADFVHEHGLRPGLLRIAHDAARIERLTFWRALAGSVRKPSTGHAEARKLVHPDVLASVASDAQALHPWLQAAGQGVPPGKRAHIRSLGTPLPYYDAFGRDDAPERILPLLSQPVVELCLRIPTWTLIAGGRDRALARRAFAPYVPAEIIGRRGKGGVDAHLGRMLDANIDFIRDLLLDGTLVRHGMLDRGKLEAFLADPAQDRQACNEVMQDYVSMEAWIGRWGATSLSAAAG